MLLLCPCCCLMRLLVVWKVAVARWYLITMGLIFPACSCTCCCSGPFVSLSSTAILTASGSSVLLSCSYLESWSSHVAKLPSNFCSSSCSRARHPTLLVPRGTQYLAWISRHVSKPSPCMFCLHSVDAGPSHVLTKM